MVLVDTSVWVNHLRQGEPLLAQALQDQLVLMHPFVLGELACGNLGKRSEVLSGLQTLPLAVFAEHEEVLGMVERHRLFGQGITWIDMHLLASALLSHSRLWTLDARLGTAAANLKVASFKAH